ncbi:MAG: zinc ribbon domain-containing protein [Candidatus Firestonebacteria bacterium]|nr:zinc ribbon domain-containing protein [Candidatus Firestonebacteria bacterium]
MPTYSYECQDCKNIFDEFQKMTDPPLTTCPKCNGKLKRLISSGSGIIFKGSGFYTTDYRNADYKKKAKEESNACIGNGKKECSSCPSKK